MTYYYVLNLQGDVVKLLYADGSIRAEYTYNAWGEILSATNPSSSSVNIQDINPLRYRGYYYDTETGFYYLQSRYYDPIVKRFINADNYASTGQGIIGHNMFAYCNNNPVCLSDNGGTIPAYSTMVTDGGHNKKRDDTDSGETQYSFDSKRAEDVYNRSERGGYFNDTRGKKTSVSVECTGTYSITQADKNKAWVTSTVRDSARSGILGAIPYIGTGMDLLISYYCDMYDSSVSIGDYCVYTIIIETKETQFSDYLYNKKVTYYTFNYTVLYDVNTQNVFPKSISIESYSEVS